MSNRPPRHLNERSRALLAALAATLTGPTATAVALFAFDATPVVGAVASALTGWIAFCTVHSWLVTRAYRGFSGARLRERLDADTSAVPRPDGKDRRGGDAGSFAATAAVLALVGVLALVLLPDLRRNAVLLCLGAGLVVTAWLDMATTYAAHYARTDLTRGGLDFTGERTGDFEDYCYFAHAVQKTFGTTDVAVTTTEMRATVRRHGMLAFAFNSVIVALLVSLMLSLG